MRKKYYADENGHWVEERPKHESHGVTILPDIEPYQSMITGEMITSRSRHREHLRSHGATEIGNDIQPLFDQYKGVKDVAPKQRHELIRAQIDALGHEGLKKALKRDIDRVKWQSRED